MIFRFNAYNLNCWFCQLGVLAKVMVLLNTEKWDSLVGGTPQYFNTVAHSPGLHFVVWMTDDGDNVYELMESRLRLQLYN